MQDRVAMAARWRERADGDRREAADAERSAVEYRIAADELEAGG